MTAYTAGQLVRQLAAPTVGNERVFVCVIAGTSLAAEPTWTITKGAKTAEAAGPTWQECTGQPGVNGDDTNTTTWTQQKGTTVSIGHIIKRDNGASLQICDTAGTAGSGSEPAFSNTPGTTTADNTVTWRCIQLTATYGDYAAPFPRLQVGVAPTWMGNAHTLYVADNHAETQASAMIITSVLSTKILCVDRTVVPPTASDLKTTATVTVSSNNNLGFNGEFYAYGFTFSSAGTATAMTFAVNNIGDQAFILENCTVALTSATTGLISLGAGRTLNHVGIVWINCKASFATVSQYLLMNTSRFLWLNTAGAIVGAAAPTILFDTPQGGTAEIRGVDLSALTSGKTLVGVGNATAGVDLLFTGCKLGSAVAMLAAGATSFGMARVRLANCDSGATNYRQEFHCFEGALTQETTIVRTGGASNGATALSWKLVTRSTARWQTPLTSFPIGIWDTVTATNREVALYGVWNAAALPNDEDVWIDVEYPGDASFPQASFKNDTKANILTAGAAQTADTTSAWDSLVTARANTTPYNLGDVRKVATNPGRIFFCTQAGTTAGSEPAGYASAVDGGSVTDNTAVFRAGFRFKLDVTLSSPQPQMAGPIYVRAYAAKISSTFYVDPLVNLS